MYSDLINDGVALMIVGMGTVFVFLSVAVVSVSLMSKLAGAIEARFTPPVAPEEGIPSDHIAAISAAVARYRATRRR